MQVNDIERALIDGWQRDLPLVPWPYREMARRIGTSESQVLAALARLSANGVLSRIGATVRPNTAGASTLAALSAPAERLDQVAAIVSAEPGVNHNYEREHALNLWFVVTGRDRAAVDGALSRLGHATGLPILDLPLETSYVVDLGFAVQWGDARATAGQMGSASRIREHTLDPSEPQRPFTEREQCILAALGGGLAIVSRPYAALAAAIGLEEDDVLGALRDLSTRGIINRLGLIVRHRELGYRANAMAVWDIADEDVDRVGTLLAARPQVSLCYRRPRRQPSWPYNLFCMVLGREREAVREQVRGLTRVAGVEARPQDVLFSTRCFKQRGANLAAA